MIADEIHYSKMRQRENNSHQNFVNEFSRNEKNLSNAQKKKTTKEKKNPLVKGKTIEK